MFGNKTGWIIASVLVVLEGALIWWISSLDQIQQPSKGMIPKAKLILNLPANPQLLEEIKLPFEPTAIYSGMTRQEDAAPHYRAALEKYLTNINIYERAWDREAKKYRSTNYRDYPGLEELIKGRECAKMNLYLSNPELVVNYRSFNDNFDSLYTIGKFANTLAFNIMDEKKDEARMLSQAVFSLGAKMMQERLRYAEFDNGQRIAREAALTLANIDIPEVSQAYAARMQAGKAYKQKVDSGAPPAEVSKAAAAMKEATDAYNQALAKTPAGQMDVAMRDLIRARCSNMWHIIGSVDQEVIGPTGGDIFHIVTHSKERMWRIEAILKLGRYRFDVGIPGWGPNQKWAGIWVRKIAKDSKEDPTVRAAGKAAAELDIEGYRSLGV